MHHHIMSRRTYFGPIIESFDQLAVLVTHAPHDEIASIDHADHLPAHAGALERDFELGEIAVLDLATTGRLWDYSGDVIAW